jgi:hypothetical protein
MAENYNVLFLCAREISVWTGETWRIERRLSDKNVRPTRAMAENYNVLFLCAREISV